MGGVSDTSSDEGRDVTEPLQYVGFNQLRSFHAVARAGSVTKAARMLYISQPTVTVQLRQLERAYGVELVHRTPQGLYLTDVGRGLFALTERIFALEEEAVNLLTQACGALTGELRVAGVGPYFVMRLLSAFSHRHPAVQLSLSLSNSADVITGLRDYRADVGVIGQPVGEPPPDSPLEAVLYSRQSVMVFVPRDHPWAEREGVFLADLADEPLILREPGSASRSALDAALTAAGVQPAPGLEVSREGVWEAVAAGLGAGITTEVEFPRDDRLHLLPILDADVATDAYVITLRDRQEAPLIRAFMSLAAELAEDAPAEPEASTAK